MSARILVVDDNKLNLKLLAAKLAKDYYTVSTAENGEEAVEVVKRELPDIVLLDIMMPVMDGFEACRILKADPATRHIPIVMVTALSDISDRVRGLECGADDFLTKPINDVALMARVRSLLRLKMVMDEWRLREATAQQFALPTIGNEDEESEIKGGHILLLEDDPFLCNAIQTALTEQGIETTATAKISDATDLARKGSYDMIMASLDLKGEDGLLLVAQMRAHETTRNLPVLLMANEGEIDHIARGLDLGANDYLIRPIETAELVARTRTQFRQKHHYDRLRRSYEQNMALALVDPLTGAYNRRYLDMHLPMLFGRCKMTQRPLSIIAIDLDHFKNVNDTHGHAAGDAVLKEAISRVMISLRPSDLIVRMGGEEFSVIMPDTEQKIALTVASRLQKALAGKPFEIPALSLSLPVTASFGVSTVNHESDSTPASVLERADTALYHAKETGRNKVVGEDRDIV